MVSVSSPPPPSSLFGESFFYGGLVGGICNPLARDRAPPLRTPSQGHFLSGARDFSQSYV